MPRKKTKKSDKSTHLVNLVGQRRKGISKWVSKKIRLTDRLDAPVIYDAVAGELSATEHDLARKAFNRGGLVGLLEATPEDITALYRILGLEMEVAPDLPKVELFALKREADGLRQVTFYAPPEVYLLQEEREHINADGSKQVSYVEVGTERMYPSKAWSKQRAKALVKHIHEIHNEPLQPELGEVAEENNLTSLAEAFKDIRMYPIGVLDFKNKTLTDYFQISSFAYACHSENDNSDWYYVYQIGQFSPSNGFFRNRKLQRLWYADNYRMNAWPTDFAQDGSVSMIQSSPDTTTGQRTATSSVSYSISGSVSYSEKGGQASATGGMSISNSLSVSIPDLSVYNKSVDQVNNAYWEFVIPKVTGKEDGCINDLNPIVAIAHNTFQPKNQWIWRADARCRNKGRAFRVSCAFAVELVNTYIGKCNIFGCNCDVNHQKYNPYPKGAISTFSIPFPPLKPQE